MKPRPSRLLAVPGVWYERSSGRVVGGPVSAGCDEGGADFVVKVVCLGAEFGGDVGVGRG